MNESIEICQVGDLFELWWHIDDADGIPLDAINKGQVFASLQEARETARGYCVPVFETLTRVAEAKT